MCYFMRNRILVINFKVVNYAAGNCNWYNRGCCIIIKIKLKLYYVF